jgi:hypothetical protein
MPIEKEKKCGICGTTVDIFTVTDLFSLKSKYRCFEHLEVK